MRLHVGFAQKKYPQQWQEYKIARAEQGFGHFASFSLGGRRAYTLRIGRVELILTSLWRVKEHDVIEERPCDDG